MARGERFQDKEKEQNSEWQERVVSLRRVAKVTRGGKRFRFTALVVVGNEKGKVGMGLGKANELVDAIRKAKDKAIRSARSIHLKGTTIPHNVLGKYKGCEIIIKPASKGTGVIAGGGVRPVLELVGIHDVLTKSIRSSNPINLVRATMNGLESLMDVKHIAEKRGKSIAEVFGTLNK
jgi:small subunit ribosomal protein S5